MDQICIANQQPDTGTDQTENHHGHPGDSGLHRRRIVPNLGDPLHHLGLGSLRNVFVHADHFGPLIDLVGPGEPCESDDEDESEEERQHPRGTIPQGFKGRFGLE